MAFGALIDAGRDQIDDGAGIVAAIGDHVAGQAKAVDEHRQHDQEPEYTLTSLPTCPNR